MRQEVKEVVLEHLRERANFNRIQYDYLEDEELGRLGQNQNEGKALSQSFNRVKGDIEKNLKERADIQAQAMKYREKERVLKDIIKELEEST